MDIKERKKQLLDRLEKSGYIATRFVRQAMENVPREDFLPEELRSSAYEDRPLSIGLGQTISAPHMNAMMCSGLKLEGATPLKVLEIGTGSGYHAALCAEVLKLSGTGGHVYTIERIEVLAQEAKDKLEKAGYKDLVTVIVSDGTLGHPAEAPYDRILVTAAAPRVPRALVNQLAEGGIMLIPVGEKSGHQTLCEVSKSGGKAAQKDVCGVVFVPLIGEDGFSK
ncbi:MAG: protein-L-isoaspartate(D-aspartate) O-methyltransferase [Candidatus Lokiarchaeota archaeon]|nr:protein-L-isoaspartate(D-aspartate) O-methyltransferase [Candidatus Lokiarchaeota archaeon]